MRVLIKFLKLNDGIFYPGILSFIPLLAILAINYLFIKIDISTEYFVRVLKELDITLIFLAILLLFEFKLQIFISLSIGRAGNTAKNTYLKKLAESGRSYRNVSLGIFVFSIIMYILLVYCSNKTVLDWFLFSQIRVIGVILALVIIWTMLLIMHSSLADLFFPEDRKPGVRFEREAGEGSTFEDTSYRDSNITSSRQRRMEVLNKQSRENNMWR